jgi:competence protein ComEA
METVSTGLHVRSFLLALLVGGVAAVALLIWWDVIRPARITLAPAPEASIVVMIDGAVATPGLVELPPGARLQQAIDAAGGLADHAVVTGLNLAARIGDGEHITIPGHLPVTAPDGSPVPTPDVSLININTAAVEELDQLPGIGPVLAQRIVDFREFHGPFASVDQLVEVSGISTAMVEELRPLVTVGG